jgi:hypothetical protein
MIVFANNNYPLSEPTVQTNLTAFEARGGVILTPTGGESINAAIAAQRDAHPVPVYGVTASTSQEILVSAYRGTDSDRFVAFAWSKTPLPSDLRLMVPERFADVAEVRNLLDGSLYSPINDGTKSIVYINPTASQYFAAMEVIYTP